MPEKEILKVWKEANKSITRRCNVVRYYLKFKCIRSDFGHVLVIFDLIIIFILKNFEMKTGEKNKILISFC